LRHPVLVVAANTFREVGRDRLFHLVGGLVTAFVLFAWVLGWLNPEESEQTRHLVDFGLAGVNVFGLLMAALMGSALLRREMERRTLYTVLSREVTRGGFVAGKYLGLVAVFAAGLGIVAAVLLGYFSLFGATPGLPLLAAIYGNLLEIAVLTAVSVLFGSFTTPALAAVGTVTAWFAGHATGTLLEYVELTENESLRPFFEFLYYALPNFSFFDLREGAAFGDPVRFGDLGIATVYAVVWVLVLVAGAAGLFRRRELP
jgi:ABC-type transport system involved in multi-copper enzyme maturation permease subunit